MENSILPQNLVAYFSKINQGLFHSFLLIGSDLELMKGTITQILEKIFYIDGSNPVITKEKIEEKIHPDLFQIEAKDKKNISIDEIRSITENAMIKPWESKYKVFVIYEIEKMSIEAANSLLKILEEPPRYVLFILTSKNIQTVPDTIISRCQIFKLENAGILHTYEALIAKKYQEHQAIVAAHLSDGNIGSAIDILENNLPARDSLIHIILCNKDPIALGEEMVSFCGSGEEGRQKAKKFIHFLCSILRDAIMVKNLENIDTKTIINSDIINDMQKVCILYSEFQLNEFIDYLLKILQMIESNVSLSLIWENICLHSVLSISKK